MSGFRKSGHLYEKYSTVFTFDPPTQNSLYIAMAYNTAAFKAVTTEKLHIVQSLILTFYM